MLGAVLPLLGPWLADRGVGAVGVGLATAAFSLAKLVWAPWVAAWVDRGHWLPRLLALHLAPSVVAASLLPLFDGVIAVTLALLVIGIGYGTVLPLVEATVLEELPASGYGALRLWGSVGFVVVAIAAPLVLGERVTACFPVLLALLLVILMLACRPYDRPVNSHDRPSQASLPAAAWLLLVVLTLHQVAHGPFYAFLSVRLADAGWASSTIGAAWALGVLAELLAFSSSAALQRRLGLARLLTLALVLTPLRWLLLALPATAPVVVLAQLGHAATFALAHAAGIQLVQRSAPPGAERHAQALYSGLAFGLGIVVGTAVAGPAYAWLGGAGSFACAAALSAVVAVAWLSIARRFREPS